MRKGLVMAAVFTIFMLSYKESAFIPKSREINEVQFVRAVSLDKAANGQMIVSALIQKEKQQTASAGGDSSGGGGGGETEIFSNEGNTAFAAQDAFQAYTDKQLFYGHTDYFLIGEEAASEDLRKYIDFITRDYEYRLTANVYITAGKGLDILTFAKDFLPDKLSNLGKSISLLSISKELPLIEFDERLEDNDKFGIAVPIVKLREVETVLNQPPGQGGGGSGQSGGGSSGGSSSGGDIKTIEKHQEVALGGYAVVMNYKLAGFLDDTLGRAYNFVTNSVGNASLEVKDQTGQYVGLEVIEANTRIKPDTSDGKLNGITIQTEFHSNVDEIHSDLDVFLEDRLKALEEEQSEIIRNEIEALVHFAQVNKADFLGVGNSVAMAHPVIWEEYKDKWPDTFGKVPIKVEVVSIIHRSYEINQPIGNKEH